MRTQTILTSIIAACSVLAIGTTGLNAAEKKSDPTGTWSWTQQGGRGGGQGGNANANATPRKVTLKLKVDGEKLTGSLTQPGFARRQEGEAATPPAPVETAISNGKVKGDEITFDVTREFNGNSRTAKYAGKIDGDTIKGKIEMPGRQGGDPVSRDWEAKRDK